jgi:hypothetical protein
MPALERLSAQDFYRQLDWLRDEWADDVEKNAKKIVRLRKMFECLPARYYESALPHLKWLALHIDAEWDSAAGSAISLQLLVSDWNRNRPPLLECEACGIAVRGHPALANHYMIVHSDLAIPAVPSG